MIQLDFRRQESGRLIAQVEAESGSLVPATNDQLYVPLAEEPGMYAHCRIVRRDFYYDQQGILVLVNLACVELASQPDAKPHRLADPPTA